MENRQRSQEQQDERRWGRSRGEQAVARRDDEGRPTESGNDPESGGNWQGYVVPYRYYGPGYRGVGYYSVMYQGPDEGDQGGTESRQETWSGQESQGGRRSGGHAGRGPKGYRRSDDRLREEVSDRLMEDDRVDASDVEVEVKDGEVTLTGTVPERSMKRRAEDVSEQVLGVRDVMNQIRVESGSSGGERQRDEQDGNKERGSSQRATENGRRRSTAGSR
jgi:osmotically-inducible protein OsmY